MMSKDELMIILSLADHGMSESPWAWSPDFKVDREKAEKAVSNFRKFIEEQNSTVIEYTDVELDQMEYDNSTGIDPGEYSSLCDGLPECPDPEAHSEGAHDV